VGHSLVWATRLSCTLSKEPCTSHMMLEENLITCQSISQRWLMVLDNADDIDVFYPKPGTSRVQRMASQQLLASFMPQTSNGRILVTSRSRDTAATLTGGGQGVLSVTAPLLSPAGPSPDTSTGTLPASAADGRNRLSYYNKLWLKLNTATELHVMLAGYNNSIYSIILSDLHVRWLVPCGQ
jgi:hypothetical protein